MGVTITEASFRPAATTQADPHDALAELDRQLRFDDANAIVMFVSSQYDRGTLQEAIRRRVRVPLLCCTTAGEISSALGYSKGGIVAAAVTGCRAKILPLAELSRNTLDSQSLIRDSNEELANCETDDGMIGLAVFDGLCRREESVIARLQSAMPTIPIVGGSAGDACEFKQTQVFVDGRFQSDAGVLLLLSGPFQAIPFQIHHFTSTGMRMVATQVDTVNRRLLRLDGISAAARLAQVLELRVEDITTDLLATRPMMARCGDVFYVRSVQRVHPDGSISFYSALREADILHIGKAGAIVDTTASYLEALRHQKSTPDLVLGFDCILRRLELELRGLTAEMNGVLRPVPFVGFSTFGEQYHGQHVNQTMTGVALWKR